MADVASGLEGLDLGALSPEQQAQLMEFKVCVCGGVRVGNRGTLLKCVCGGGAGSKRNTSPQIMGQSHPKTGMGGERFPPPPKGGLLPTQKPFSVWEPFLPLLFFFFPPKNLGCRPEAAPGPLNWGC